MQGTERRKRRCALDSDTPEEFMQLAQLVQNQMNVYYDDRKIMEVKKFKKVMKKSQESNELGDKQDEMAKIQMSFDKGFEHNFDEYSPKIQYCDSKDLPPRIDLPQSLNSLFSGGTIEEIVSFNIMIIGQITNDFRQFVTLFCKAESRKNSDEFEPDIISPMKCKLCLDIAVKKVSCGRIRQNVIKFLMHDSSISSYEAIINVYLKQCKEFVIYVRVSSKAEDFKRNIQTIYEKIEHRIQEVNHLFVILLLENEMEEVDAKMEQEMQELKRSMGISDYFIVGFKQMANTFSEVIIHDIL